MRNVDCRPETRLGNQRTDLANTGGQVVQVAMQHNNDAQVDVAAGREVIRRQNGRGSADATKTPLQKERLRLPCWRRSS